MHDLHSIKVFFIAWLKINRNRNIYRYCFTDVADGVSFCLSLTNNGRRGDRALTGGVNTYWGYNNY